MALSNCDALAHHYRWLAVAFGVIVTGGGDVNGGGSGAAAGDDDMILTYVAYGDDDHDVIRPLLPKSYG